jgi:hypothetical protein
VSRNFELMQGATVKLGVPEIVEPKSASTPRNKKTEKRSARYTQDETSREESQKLVRSIFGSRSAGAPSFIVFASIDSWDSCSRICTNAADTLASQGSGRVCVVTENSQSPAFQQLLGSPDFGFGGVLSNAGPVRGFARPVRSDNLWLLSCEWLGLSLSAAMNVRASELRRDFDYVLIESPPLNDYSDGLALAKSTDGIVLILEATSTPRRAAARVVQSLRDAQIKILGAILNGHSR